MFQKNNCLGHGLSGEGGVALAGWAGSGGRSGGWVPVRARGVLVKATDWNIGATWQAFSLFRQEFLVQVRAGAASPPLFIISSPSSRPSSSLIPISG